MGFLRRLGSGPRRVFAVAALVGWVPAAMSHGAEAWNTDDLRKFIDGATIMAAGGGGSPSIANKLLSTYFDASSTVTLNNVAKTS